MEGADIDCCSDGWAEQVPSLMHAKRQMSILFHLCLFRIAFSCWKNCFSLVCLWSPVIFRQGLENEEASTLLFLNLLGQQSTALSCFAQHFGVIYANQWLKLLLWFLVRMLLAPTQAVSQLPFIFLLLVQIKKY